MEYKFNTNIRNMTTSNERQGSTPEVDDIKHNGIARKELVKRLIEDAHATREKY